MDNENNNKKKKQKTDNEAALHNKRKTITIWDTHNLYKQRHKQEKC